MESQWVVVCFEPVLHAQMDDLGCHTNDNNDRRLAWEPRRIDEFSSVTMGFPSGTRVKGERINGNFVKVFVPPLEYWNMIYMSADDYIDFWEWRTGKDLHRKCFSWRRFKWCLWKKVNFYGTDPYYASVSQTVSGNSPGTYTVSAKVKQNNGNPSSSHMQITGKLKC